MPNNYGSGGFSLPNPNIKESEKNEEYHKKYVLSIANRSFNGAYDLDYLGMSTCEQFYQGLQSNGEFDFLQSSADGDVLPAKWINFNKIKVKVNLLLGELIRKNYTIDVSSINKEAKVRKLEARETARADLKLQPFAEELEQEFGIPLINGQTFEDEETLEDFYKYNYKEKSEIIVKSSLDWIAKRNKWDYERIALMRDVLITNRCFTKTEIINGVPVTRRIDPKYVIWDRNSTDDFLTDSAYFGEVRYMNVGDAADKYDVTEKELKEIYASRGSGSVTDYSGSTVSHFKEEEGELRVLVLEAYWVDYRKVTAKVSKDKFSNEHVRLLSNDTDAKKDIIAKQYKVWRKGTLLGGKILKDWGVIKNMPRSIDDPADTGCPVKGLVPHYVGKQAVSIVEQLKGLQNLKDITMYSLQLAMSRAGAKGFVYDTSQTPENWDIHTVIKYLKTAGIAFINSAQDGIPAQFNQFQQFDMTLSNSVEQYLKISMMVDREMDAVSGINEARQGQVQGASQAVGVTQSALFQSSLSTESYFELFRQYVSDIYNYQAGMIKIAWAGKERFAPIIGDVGFNFLRTDLDLSLDDYAVFVADVNPVVSDFQNLQQIVQAGIQNDQISIVDAIKILKEKDIDYAIRSLERSIQSREREKQKQQEAAFQAEQQAAQQAQEAAGQQGIAQEEAKTQGGVVIEGEKRKTAVAKETTKGKVDLIKQKSEPKSQS